MFFEILKVSCCILQGYATRNATRKNPLYPVKVRRDFVYVWSYAI